MHNGKFNSAISINTMERPQTVVIIGIMRDWTKSQIYKRISPSVCLSLCLSVCQSVTHFFFIAENAKTMNV